MLDDIKEFSLPSVHLLEIFMPYRNDEARMLNVLKRAVGFEYYKGVEIGLFFDATLRHEVRSIIHANGLNQTLFITPWLKERKLSLCSLDSDVRAQALKLSTDMLKLAADQGCAIVGLPSGDDPGDDKLRSEAKKVLTDAVGKIADLGKELGVIITIEPLDRFAYKKQLIGPMAEVVEWIAPINAEHPNFLMHWDSAHEALGSIDLMKSIDLAGPYIAQFHLCDAILDRSHPCFGDLHMDVGTAPDYATEGFLTPEIGAGIIRRIAALEKPRGIKNVFASVEVLGHPGDDLWRKELNARRFIQRCFEIAKG